ncbi:protein kinase, partial [Streptomyces sp. NPDC001709]
MDDYAGRVLADRYRLPLPPSDEYELTETRAFDTYSGQEVLVRQVPLPEVVEAEVLDAEGLPEGFTARQRGTRRTPDTRTATRRPADPAVRRAVEAVQAAARIPDHPRLDQVFDVFAEGGSLWIVSELVAARPLAALLAEQPLSPYRAAEVASDVLMALRVLHAHGWVHRNITARTVLVCDDGRVMLTGLAVGAAEEALSGYDPVPAQDGTEEGSPGAAAVTGGVGTEGIGSGSGGVAGGAAGAGGASSADADPEAARRAAIQARAAGGLPVPGANGVSGGTAVSGPAGQRPQENGADIRAARAGAIAAYRAGARAAARVQEARQDGRAALPGARQPVEGGTGAERADGTGTSSYPGGPGGTTPPGRIADPYGVQGAPWHGAAPRPGSPSTSPALSGGPQRPGLPAANSRPGHPSVPGQPPSPDLDPTTHGTDLPPNGTGSAGQGSAPPPFGTGSAGQGSAPPPFGTGSAGQGSAPPPFGTGS